MHVVFWKLYHWEGCLGEIKPRKKNDYHCEISDWDEELFHSTVLGSALYGLDEVGKIKAKTACNGDATSGDTAIGSVSRLQRFRRRVRPWNQCAPRYVGKRASNVKRTLWECKPIGGGLNE